MVNYFSAVGTLENKRNEYRTIITDVLTSAGDRAEAIATVLDLTDQLAHLKDAHGAFMAQFSGAGVPSPGDAVIQNSTDLATVLAAAISRANTAVAVLHIVTQFVTDWGTLSGAAPAAPPPGVPAAAPPPAAAVPAAALNMSFLKTHG
jgi:hypothetical protein